MDTYIQRKNLEFKSVRVSRVLSYLRRDCFRRWYFKLNKLLITVSWLLDGDRNSSSANYDESFITSQMRARILAQAVWTMLKVELGTVEEIRQQRIRGRGLPGMTDWLLSLLWMVHLTTDNVIGSHSSAALHSAEITRRRFLNNALSFVDGGTNDSCEANCRRLVCVIAALKHRLYSYLIYDRLQCRKLLL